MNIALIAHDKKKELMAGLCVAYARILSRHTLCATGNTGKLISDATGLEVKCYLPGRSGGAQQIGLRAAYNEIDLVILLRDPMQTERNEPDNSLLRLCDIHSIPVATNAATAEILLHGLARGDLAWRDVVNPK